MKPFSTNTRHVLIFSSAFNNFSLSVLHYIVRPRATKKRTQAQSLLDIQVFISCWINICIAVNWEWRDEADDAMWQFMRQHLFIINYDCVENSQKINFVHWIFLIIISDWMFIIMTALLLNKFTNASFDIVVTQQ